MDFPKKYFLRLENLCPTFHADIYLLFKFNLLYGEK